MVKNNSCNKYLLLIVVCIGFGSFWACQPSVNGRLQNAERLMKSKPDSAFLFLVDLRGEYAGMNEPERALFGYLYFRAWDERGRNDSVDVAQIDFAIDYYAAHPDRKRLAECYVLRACAFEERAAYTEAINNLLKAKDIAETLPDHILLGRIYADLGHISAFFEKYDKALDYFNLSIRNYEQDGNTGNAARVHMAIGWLYGSTKNYTEALPHTLKALSVIKDSLTTGDLLEDMGDYHLENEAYDSAYYYFRESLLYPAYKTNYSIRYYGLAKLFFEIGQYDSSRVYIDRAMSAPVDIAYRANCYRLLAGIASETGTKRELEQYVALYQGCQDSVNKRKRQPQIDIVEKIYQSDVEKANIKNQRSWLVAGIIAILLVGGGIFVCLCRRNRKKQESVDFYRGKHTEGHELYNEVQQQVDVYKAELRRKHDLLLAQLKQEVEITRERYADRRKKASSPQERRAIDRAIYHEVLQVDNEQAFMEKMNQLLSNLPHRLQSDYPAISYRQIVWCCLFILDINTMDIALIMGYTPASLYKFKQRLSKKLHFENVRKLEQMLYEKLDL